MRHNRSKGLFTAHELNSRVGRRFFSRTDEAPIVLVSLQRTSVVATLTRVTKERIL